MPRFQTLLKFFNSFSPKVFQLFILTLTFWSGSLVSGHAETAAFNIHEGIADYKNQNFEQAENHFSKAQKENPDNSKLNYNLANSHYKNGRYQEALKSYSNATEKNTTPDIEKNSLYNSGNALYRMGKLEESITAYKKALALDPKDMDAKFNLEFVREKLKEKQQKQNKPQEKDSMDNDQLDQNPSPDNDSDTLDNDNNSTRQENQKPSSPEEFESGEDKPSELAQIQENSISKQQAEQWLSGLQEDLKKFSQKQAHAEKGTSSPSSRDW